MTTETRKELPEIARETPKIPPQVKAAVNLAIELAVVIVNRERLGGGTDPKTKTA